MRKLLVILPVGIITILLFFSCASIQFVQKEEDVRYDIYAIKQLPAPEDIPTNEAFAVWGYMGNKKGTIGFKDESVEDMARKVSWAIVLKVRMGDGKKKD